MLDDDQRVARLNELAQGAHEFGDVVKVQAGSRLVQQEQRAAVRAQRQSLTADAGRRRLGLAALASLATVTGQKAGELEALRLTARQRGHGLAELDVFQPHVHDGLQRANHLAVVSKQLAGFADSEVQNVSHVHHHGAAVRAAALDFDFQNFRAVALAVAVSAAQVDITQKLHLNMLKARATAGRATAIAAVEAELGRCVAALTRQRRKGKQLAHRVPGAHIAGRVGACRLTDRRLVHKHHIAQMIGAHQAVVQARRFGGFAELTQQSRRQYVLHQGRFARAADPGHHHQALQRKIDADVFQVVVARAFQNQTRCVVAHGALETHADLLARTQVSASQRVGVAQLGWRAIKHNLSAFFAGAGAHVDHAVSSHHHGRVVLDHHQRVAGVTQPVHGLGDAVHVARVQADGRLVQHKQGVHQRGAQRRGQVDALHLAA